MALIKCKKCGKEISSKAKTCVHCGYKKNKFIWLIILSVFLFLLVIGSFIGLVVYIVIDSSNYTGTWTQVTDYYEKSDPTRFICRVESKLIIDEVDEIKYVSKVTKGDCEYDEVNSIGEYSYDFDRIEAEFKYYNKEYDVDIFNKNEYLCYDNCSTRKNYFYKEVKEENVYNEYIDYYKYTDQYNNDYSNQNKGIYTEIGYSKYKELIREDGKFILFIGSKSCPYCNQLDNTLNEIASKYQLPNMYFLDISLLTDGEQEELFKELNLNPSIPVLRIYNNGLQDTIVGYQNEGTLIEAFMKANVFNNSNL